MISVKEAQDLCLSLIAPLEAETVPLSAAFGRVLADPVVARRDQPPFSASAMDGYAVKAVEVERDAQFKVIGESAAGHGYAGRIGAGQAVRIFTGAPVPEGADSVLIQEDVDRTGDLIVVTAEQISMGNIRPQGADFTSGDQLDAPRVLSASDLALIAAMNAHDVAVRRQPRVALLTTGDELVMPGGDPGPDQIIASNVFALEAMLRDVGAVPRIFPIAADTPEALDTLFQSAADWPADIVVTIGGASVGDHDLVAPAMDRFGVTRAFHRIAMRPGKPLMAGAMGDMAWLGLPGNPVAAIVCGHLFLLPMVRALAGAPDVLPQVRRATLTHDLGANGPREHYMRARVSGDDITVFDKQDSALLTVLSHANALAIRPVADPARPAGGTVKFIFI